LTIARGAMINGDGHLFSHNIKAFDPVGSAPFDFAQGRRCTLIPKARGMRKDQMYFV
jgi:hypothetical protein